MTLLLHACCAPCLGGAYPAFSQDHHDILAFWENPNIHPFLEYKARLESFQAFVQTKNISAVYGNSEYGLDKFLLTLNGDFGSSRCAVCFEIRLKSAAQKALELACEAFSSTLLISPYQNHELILSTAARVSKNLEIPFFYKDVRGMFKDTFALARENYLYRQKYCGCVFSERDRFIQRKAVQAGRRL
ncbi:epoxyqueuosine reductase QueH [bacterium]|nr:epoxyqueuosine reductase QueH [bacterium]